VLPTSLLQYNINVSSQRQNSNISVVKENISSGSSDEKSIINSNSPHDDTSTNNSEILNRLYELSQPERKLILASAGTLAVTSSITLILPWT